MGAMADLRAKLEWAPHGTSAHWRWHYEGVALVDDWHGCPMVNPLCPDDLCFLPYAHPGMGEGIHMLGTSSEPERWTDFELHPLGPKATRQQLVEHGWKLQHKMFPDHHVPQAPKWSTDE